MIFPWKNICFSRELANQRAALDRCWTTHVWPTDCLSAQQAYQCKITKSTVMATQNLRLFWREIAYPPASCEVDYLFWNTRKYWVGKIENKLRVESEEKLLAHGVCLFTKPGNISDLKVLKTKLGSGKIMHFCVYLNFHTNEFPKFALI